MHSDRSLKLFLAKFVYKLLIITICIRTLVLLLTESNFVKFYKEQITFRQIESSLFLQMWMKRDGGDSPRWRCGRFHYKIFLKHPAIGFYNSTKRKKIDLWPNGRSKSSQGSSKLFNLGRFWFVTAAAPSKKRNSNGGVLDHIMDGYLLCGYFFVCCLDIWFVSMNVLYWLKTFSSHKSHTVNISASTWGPQELLL